MPNRALRRRRRGAHNGPTIREGTDMERSAPDSSFVSLCQRCGVSGNLEFWQSLVENLAARDDGLRRNAAANDDDPGMESGVSVIAELDEAPARTLGNAPVASSSPLPVEVRALLETREFGRPYDSVLLDL